MMRVSTRVTITVTVIAVAGLLVTSSAAVALLGTDRPVVESDESNAAFSDAPASSPSASTSGVAGDGSGAEPLSAPLAALDSPAVDPGGGVNAAVALTRPERALLTQEREPAVEEGVDRGVELVQAQGIEVTQEQRAAAMDAANATATRHQEADVQQVQAATTGAVHGTLVQEQRVNTTQIQAAIAGATDGALAQHRTATASQLQSAAWGATHGAIAQGQRVTVEQLQVTAYGAAAGAASSAGEHEVDDQPMVQEAAQGAAYGALAQYQQLTAEQRQAIPVEHVQRAAAGAAAGTLEGSTDTALEQDQRVAAEQRQQVTIKEIQTAAKGAAAGALVQRQSVTVEQTQSAARGAGAGAIKQVQSIRVEQVQRLSTAKIEEATRGAATGAITQSQEATVEQIQAAADGGVQGVLVQHQEVSITQIQAAATGASKGAVESAVQYQVVDIEQIQAVARGAGEGAVIQTQVVTVTQVQRLAAGSAQGALTQYQEATVTQLQVAAASASQETARAIQFQSQRLSLAQLQTLTAETAAETTSYAVQQGIDDETRLVQYVEIEVTQRIEEIDELEGTAAISFSNQNTSGETVEIDSVSLSEGGFVAIYDETTATLDPDDVIGVSSYLEPGDHENVAIELEEPLDADRALTAAVHHDTTDDETFRYVERAGGDDEPYVSEGGAPVLDTAFVTVDEAETPDEREASLSVSDQTGDGETLLVDDANASVDYFVSATYNGERVDSDIIDAGDAVSAFELELEPPVAADGPIAVSVRAADDDEALANETIEFTIDDPIDPDAVLSVGDQTGDGESLTIEAANASVDYALTVADENGTQLAETDPFDAGEAIENETIDLETPLESSSLLEVSLVAVEENRTLETELLEYTVDESFQVEFANCTRAEVTGTFEEGDRIAASTGFYAAGGFGNTIIEDFVRIGEDTEAPFTGTIVFEVGAEDEFDGETITVGVPEYGTFGTYISGISSPEAIPFAGIDHPNPQAQACNEEVRPAEPAIAVEETTVSDDDPDSPVIDVTFGSENPNDVALPGISEFVDGTTDEEPVDALEPGEDEFTVEWTPAAEDERLGWQFDLAHFGYEEPLIAETPTAGEILGETTDPAAFAVEIDGTNSPVEQGDPLEIEALVENVGGEAGEQDVELALDGTVVDSTTVALDPAATEAVSLSAETSELEPGEYTATVATENETAETSVTVSESADPAEFSIDDLSASSSFVAGQDVTVAATITNTGDQPGSQPVTYSVDGTPIAEADTELEPGETTVLTFSSTVPEGESTHTVATADEQASVTIDGIAAPPDETPADEPTEETPPETDGGGSPADESPDEQDEQDEQDGPATEDAADETEGESVEAQPGDVPSENGETDESTTTGPESNDSPATQQDADGALPNELSIGA
ncbi:DUF7282 domain-containing protein [Natrialba asiatica]|uniref:CARDB domain-containing protein n=1 Tax=Natrialba asiatica (strain ATCC 700177 / DSM 12278 / JCM 9576 / FERM P-10747 / NBRC 102637 / 172P1) TaxID=29540 RepID=M0AYE0_NATA1|nr:CARDB domain-containing protein [Natrialba asiatica]ELZ03495.1 hypothetical protein C481_05860 [Natrialba asiatica DSM 12278]